MIELPAAVAPWSAELSLLSSDLALMLAPWLGRLALALGPMSEVRTSRSGEPDGYDGLARRGSYERLVMADWAIADAFPEEFLRRAAASEHLFLDLVRREPRSAGRCIVVLSAGPAQLGAPRLVHLAALIVMARRAARAGASFAWGLLEDPDTALRHGLDAAGIRRLLDGRTARSAGEAAVAAWRDALGASRDEPVDWWLVGAAEVARWGRAASASCLVVRDVLEPSTRAVEVEVVRSAVAHRPAPPARLRLALPEPDVCVRLLRDPLAVGAGMRVAVSPFGHRVRFVARGRKLLVVHGDGDTTTWPIPQSPREPLGASRSTKHTGATVALGMQGRTLIRASVDTRDPSELLLSFAGAPPAVRARLPEDVVAALRSRLDRGLEIGECAEVRLREHHRDIIVEGPLGRMYLVAGLDPARHGPRNAERVATPFVAEVEDAAVVVSLLRARDASWIQITPRGEIQIARTTPDGTAVVWRLQAHGPGGRGRVDAHFACGAGTSQGWGPVAVHAGGPSWQIERWDQAPQFVRTNDPVVGAEALGHTPRLLTQPEPGRLVWTTGATSEELVSIRGVIEEVAVSAFEPHVAWRTTTGEVTVYSIQHKAVLMRLLPAERAGGRSP